MPGGALLAVDQEPVEPSGESDELGGPSGRDQRPRDIWLGRSAGVVADRQTLIGQTEDDLCGDHEAREPDRMDLSAGDRCAARLRVAHAGL